MSEAMNKNTAPVVKKLIWERDGRGNFQANCSVESYRIDRTPPSWPDDERFRLCYGEDSCPHHWNEYPTEEEAMSAAQSHLEEMVLDVLDL